LANTVNGRWSLTCKHSPTRMVCTWTKGFRTVGIDAFFDEKTPEAVHIERKKQWDSLPKEKQKKLWSRIIELNKENMDNFMLYLRKSCEAPVEVAPR
jgi:hypothetical protein